jgi:ubiquinone/menaquinone biosynthesis C-methylase UbiE
MIKMDRRMYEYAHNYDKGELWSIFANLSGGSLLDVGCGTGRVLKFLNKQFYTKFLLSGIEKNEALWSENRMEDFSDDLIDITVGDFLDLECEEPFDYLTFISSIHQFPDTKEVIEMIDSLAKKAVIIKTVDTARIMESSIRILYPELPEYHFPIYKNITKPLHDKGFTLTLEKNVKYSILTSTEHFVELCKNRFVSALHNLSDEKITAGTDKIFTEKFYRQEVISYLVYEKNK